MKNILQLTLAVGFIASAHVLLAQPGMQAAPGIPIDGGLSALIAGGVGYGVKKMRDRKRAAADNDQSQEA